MKITIIGAGIGGLTTAIALEQKGFQVEIFEASPIFKKAGSGINLAINVMQIYKRLGLYDEIANLGSYTKTMCITDQNLSTLSAIDLTKAEKQFNAKTYAIHRAILHSTLVNKLENTTIHLNKKLKTLKQINNTVDMTFEDGTKHTADIVIGADGIHSNVRKSIFKNTELRTAKQACWRGIVKMKNMQKYQTELNELWGKGKRFGFVYINEEDIYWYALANYKTDYKKEFSSIKLDELFTSFSPIAKEIIAKTNNMDILFNEIQDLKPLETWHSNNICLIGDAAHATTPNMGQGACQAIETGYVLSECLAKEKNPKLAFEELERIRKSNVLKIINSSWKIGKMAHLENNLAIRLRNTVIKIIPKKMAQKKSFSIFDLNY